MTQARMLPPAVSRGAGERREERLARWPAVRPRGGDLAALAILLLGSLALGLTALARRPDLYANGSFLFGDHSLNLLVADRLLAGETLYQDVASPYGPLPAYAYAAWAVLFGSSVASFNAFLLAVSLLNLGLVYLLLRRFAAPGVSLLVAGVGMVPSLLVPGSLLGGYTVSTYLPVERLFLILTALAWCPPPGRSPARAARIGVVLGLWQGVKFGGAFFAGAAVLLVDLLALHARPGGERDWVGWFRSLLVTLAAFLAVQAAWVGYAFLALSPQVALDFLWPSYALETYSAWVADGERWPSWQGWSLFLGQYLSPVVGALAGVAALGWYLRRAGELPGGDAGREVRGLALLLPLVFYLIASFAYFRQVYHFLQFAWVLVIPAAWLAQRSGARTRAALALLFLPCFALNLKAVLLNSPDSGMRPVRAPSGETLWMAPQLEADMQALLHTLRPPGGGTERPEAVFLPIGAGMQHFYGVPVRLRQPWALPGFIRPYDEQEYLGSLRRARAVVLLRQPGQDPSGADPCAAMASTSPFPPRVCAAMAARVGEPVPVGEHFLVFPVREQGAE